jgi:hypothetical protein
MNFKCIAIVAAMAATLVETAAITADSAFATQCKDKNQAVSHVNTCGNGRLPLNIVCQNVGSQIQGDENSVALAADQAFPSISDYDYGEH